MRRIVERYRSRTDRNRTNDRLRISECAGQGTREAVGIRHYDVDDAGAGRSDSLQIGYVDEAGRGGGCLPEANCSACLEVGASDRDAGTSLVGGRNGEDR